MKARQVALEHETAALAAREMKAVLSVVAPGEDDESRRAPLHLVAVLDKSGSMGGDLWGVMAGGDLGSVSVWALWLLPFVGLKAFPTTQFRR